ncbi:hypothetical protein LFZ31_24090 [Salmonella enterica subsp. enterica serovar Newport str. S09097]|nr:hypothetical protein LFZ31_24090 [Salmonella enterica subsp. enterica serovar Newport str. S09097]
MGISDFNDARNRARFVRYYSWRLPKGGQNGLKKVSVFFSLHDRCRILSSSLCGKATILLGVLPIILPIKRRFTHEKAFTVSVIS